MELAFALLAAISLAVGLSNALTSKDVVKLLKKTKDRHDRAMLKGMVWCKGSHGFHFVFGIIPMFLMAFGGHQEMIWGMWGMFGVSILAGLMSLIELWDRYMSRIDDVIEKAIDVVTPDPELRAQEMLKKIKERLNETH